MSAFLVAYATKHGATADIANSIAEALRGAGHTADVREAHDVRTLDGYDGVILGSAVYMGRWHGDAVAALTRFEGDLRARSTWLFSSGPIGGTTAADAVVERAIASPTQPAPPREIASLARRIGVLGHATFPGRIGQDMTGLLERWMPRGDWRDLGAVRGWARRVAAEMAA